MLPNGEGPVRSAIRAGVSGLWDRRGLRCGRERRSGRSNGRRSGNTRYRYRTPEVHHLAIQLHEHLVQVPTPVPETPHPQHTLAADLTRKHRAEPVPPESHRLMAEVDPALEKKILHIQKRQRETDIHHHDQADHLGRGIETAKRTGRLGPRLAADPPPLSARSARCHVGLTARLQPRGSQGADRGLAAPLQYRAPAQKPRLSTAGSGSRSITSAVLRCRYAPPPANTSDEGNHALTIKPDHSLGAGQATVLESSPDVAQEPFSGQEQTQSCHTTNADRGSRVALCFGLLRRLERLGLSRVCSAPEPLEPLLPALPIRRLRR